MRLRRSSHLSSIDYSAFNQLLGINFHNGSRYEYSLVPPHVFQRLRLADRPGSKLGSIGQAFHKLIKNKYNYRKVSPTDSSKTNATNAIIGGSTHAG